MSSTDLGVPIPLGPFATLSKLTISKEVFLSNLNSGLTYPLDTYAAFPYTITEVYGIQCSSGSATVAVEIAGTAVPGLNSMSVTSTSATNYPVTSGGVVAVGQAVSLVFSGVSSPTNIQFTLAATRNS